MEIPVINLSDLNGTNGFRLDGEKALDESGFSVSNAGDVNGDGFDDVIVGASGRNLNGGSASGSSYVVFGKASGFNAVMNLSSLDGANGFRVDAESTYDYSSASFSDAGDVNGDGFDELFVRAFGFDLNGGSALSTYVVFGKTSGFDAALDLSSLDGLGCSQAQGFFFGRASSGDDVARLLLGGEHRADDDQKRRNLA